MTQNKWLSWVISIGGIDYDRTYGKQCVDLVNNWALNVLGIKDCFYGLRYAYEIYTKFEQLPKLYQNFSKISVSKPGEYPKMGDVIVWKKGETKKRYGHVALVLYADLEGFTVIEQNHDDKGTLRRHSYSNSELLEIAGWLRPFNQKNINGYGNAYMLENQPVYSSSKLHENRLNESAIDTIYKGERVYHEGLGDGNAIIVYQKNGHYMTGFVKGKAVKKD